MSDMAYVTDLVGRTTSTYRYALSREVSTFGDYGHGVFVMLNPSTADQTTDDPTIRRCIGFAKRFGWKKLVVVNLFAARATDPDELRRLDAGGLDIRGGPLGDFTLGYALGDAKRCGAPIIAAWGASGGEMAALRVSSLLRLASDIGWLCLGTTKDGHPRHPLYVRADAELVRWIPRRTINLPNRSTP